MNGHPKIEDAPGLVWRKRRNGWEARWVCRADLSKRGYEVKGARLWVGEVPDELDVQFIQSECRRLQTDMLIWGKGGIPQVMTFDGTIAGLIDAYQRDKDSPYRKLRYQTRVYYDALCKRLINDFGSYNVDDIKARDLRRWHESFEAEGHIPMGHSCVGMLRTILTFGSTILEDDRCKLLRVTLHDMRFPVGKARTAILTAEQVIAIRAEARRIGRHSISLAQAIQYELMLRQRDTIGEWVPVSEPGLSYTIWGNAKWMRGIDWREIDQDMTVTHITSKRQKEIVVNLRAASMVMEEIDLAFPGWGGDRANLPASGPLIINEATGVPWIANEFRRHWRIIATAVGVPKGTRNMDSRAGAITEATQAGAPLESIKQAATHSDISMTQRYARGAEEKTADVLNMRQAHRANKSGT
jgi:hypothetical protein